MSKYDDHVNAVLQQQTDNVRTVVISSDPKLHELYPETFAADYGRLYVGIFESVEVAAEVAKKLGAEDGVEYQGFDIPYYDDKSL